MLSTLFRRRLLSLLPVVMVLAMSACKDDSTGLDDDEPEVASVRLTIGTQVITISDNGTVSPTGTIVLPVGTSNVSAVWLDVTGAPIEDLSRTEFQLNLTVSTAGAATFARSTTDPFAGTLTATAPAAGVVIRFALFHLEEQHEDFGPFPVTFTFQN
jgi:hypothetical protein